VAFSIHEVLICLVSEEWVDCLIRLAKLGYTPQRRNCVLSLCSHELFWVYFYALFHMKIMTICTLYIPEEKFSGQNNNISSICNSFSTSALSFVTGCKANLPHFINYTLFVYYSNLKFCDRENRYCNLCNCQKLGDEYHYVLECSFLNDKRKQLLPK
jgi:hypothetical protein